MQLPEHSPFTEASLSEIGQVLGCPPAVRGNHVHYEWMPEGDHTRKLSVEVYPDIPIGKRHGALVSVFTTNAHLQLHFCTGFVASEDLGEVTFVAEASGKVSGLILEREGGCSLYTNVDRELLSGDFTLLAPEVMLSGVALSLTEHLLTDEPPTAS